MLKKSMYLKKEDIVHLNDFEEFLVPSEMNQNQFYAVNRKSGICECADNIKGNFCKHLRAVCLLFEVSSKGMPPVTIGNRQLMAYITMGNKAPPKECFLPLHTNSEGTDNSK